MIKYVCPFCESESSPKIDSTGDMPTGMLIMCDCPEARADWETKHRADMERRKKARSRPKNNSIIHAGRTPHPMGKRRR